MKEFSYLLLITVLMCSLFSCAPKVVTSVLKNYPSLSENEEVAIYERENDDKVPANAETVGNIAVVDNGFSIGGSYEKVLNMASIETRKNGGNGLLITDHLKPSFWGSTIHQIFGVMLKIDENDTVLVPSKETYVSIQEENERKRIRLPGHTFSFKAGYGGITNRSENLSGNAKKIENQLSNGITCDAQYYYHHKGLPYGFGVMASQFYSSPFQDAVYNDIDFQNRLDYLALSFGIRTYFSPQWMWGIYFGYGYLGLNQKLTQTGNLSNSGTITGATFGTHLGFVIEYQFSKRFGIGADLSAISGSFSSVKYNNLTPDPSTPSINDENRLGASRLNATIGFRYYLK